jgi:CheY-like chemotaxis protein
MDPRTARDGALRSSAVSEVAPSFTILVIEDNEDVRWMVRRHLESDGYSVLDAEDGQCGLDLIETYPGPVDLVLTDVDMPHVGRASPAMRAGVAV